MRDTSFHDFIIHDLLGGVPGIVSRAMFSGWGIYKDGIIFGIIALGELYFKVDDSNRIDFERLQSHPFTYNRDDKRSITMSYWLVPEEIMENREELKNWILKSMKASLRSKKVS